MPDDQNQLDGNSSDSAYNEDQISKHRNQLRPESRQALGLSLEERLRLIVADKFILYEGAKDILSILKDLLARPVSERPPCYLLTGPSNSGKTGLINRYRRDLGGESSTKVGVHDLVPLLIVPLPARPTDPRIALAIARRVNVPVFTRQPSREVSDLILRELGKRETRVLVLLEFDNLEPLSDQERKISFDFIKDFTNQGISVIGVGTEKSVQLISKDDELNTRLRPLRLKGFACDKEFGSFLATLETFYPFGSPSYLPRFAADIHGRTRGVLGEVVLLVNEAAVWAAKNGKSYIDGEALKKCNYIAPARPEGVQ